jgi:hypothetical protein
MWKKIASRFSLMKSKPEPEFEESVRELRDKLAAQVRVQFGNFLDECRNELETEDKKQEVQNAARKAVELREQLTVAKEKKGIPKQSSKSGV